MIHREKEAVFIGLMNTFPLFLQVLLVPLALVLLRVIPAHRVLRFLLALLRRRPLASLVPRQVLH